MPVIDLATKIISPEKKIWLVHPGNGRRYYDFFYRNKMVFLLMPGLNLKETSFGSVEKIRQHIRMANALRKYSSSDTNDTPPSRNINTYSSDSGNDVNSAVGNVISLYQTAQPGDLVVVTGYGQYSRVLMGEITTEFDPTERIELEGKFSYADVQYRKVKWISTKYQRRDFEEELAKRLVNRKACVQLNRDAMSEQLYRYAYLSYILGNKSKVEFEGPDYSGTNPLELYPSVRLVSYFAAAYAAIQDDRMDEFKALSISAAINEFYDPSLMENFMQEFNSPGKFEMFAKASVMALFITIGVAAATSDISFAEFAQNLSVTNSKDSGADADLDSAAEKFDFLMNSLGNDKLNELDELGQESTDTIGLKSPAKVKK